MSFFLLNVTGLFLGLEVLGAVFADVPLLPVF